VEGNRIYTISDCQECVAAGLPRLPTLLLYLVYWNFKPSILKLLYTPTTESVTIFILIDRMSIGYTPEEISC